MTYSHLITQDVPLHATVQIQYMQEDIHAVHCTAYPTVFVVITQLMCDAIHTVHETQVK